MKTHDKNITYVEYICAKCGSIVEISTIDEVVCNVCLFNILFKKRGINIKKIKAI